MNNLSDLRFFTKEIKKEIMSTDVFIGVIAPKSAELAVYRDIEHSFDIFRQFEKRFSRFIKGNELSEFNEAAGEITVSEDLFELLQLSLFYNKKTYGFFDITVLPYLLSEGYSVSSSKGFHGTSIYEKRFGVLKDLELSSNGKSVFKHSRVGIDLGGIGKGFIINKVSNYLKRKYKNYIIDAGGDIYYSGADLLNPKGLWYSGVSYKKNIALKIQNIAVATSSTSKRQWLQNGEVKNHLIDPATKKSITSDIVSATVIAENIIDADILAKFILSLRISNALNYAKEHKLATLFLSYEDKFFFSEAAKNYIVFY